MNRIMGSFKKAKHSSSGSCSSTDHLLVLPRIQITQQMAIDELDPNQEQLQQQQGEEREYQDNNKHQMRISPPQLMLISPTSTSSTAKILPEEQSNNAAENCTATSTILVIKDQPPVLIQDGLLSANKYQDRQAINRQSTGTLNRLILVAQALESEVDWRRRSDMNSSRIVFTLRLANLVLLVLVNLLIFTGVGQYQDKHGNRVSLLLTMDKWYFRPRYNFDELPPTFSEIRLTGQFCAAALSVMMLLSTVLLQAVHCCRLRHPKLLCVFYAFTCVPISLFIFGLEMHYSACPWLDDFLNTQVMRRNFVTMEKYIDTQCGVNGWALAGIFSLLSCGLFISDGLISAFFKSDETHSAEPEKIEAIL